MNDTAPDPTTPDGIDAELDAELDDDERDPVDLLAEEAAERLRRGEAPSIAEYVARRPDLKDEIEALFPALFLMERARRESRGPGAPGAKPPERLGDFRIVRELGRGGMGIVYEAVQESLGRRVALKVLPAGSTSGRATERFRREAQAAATLHHTHIVQVFGVGAQDGLLYYVMQLVEGRSLEQLLDADPGAPLEPRRAARIGAQVARGLAHAHARGVLHRDVKPANVLLDAQDAAYVADFGLAKLLGEEDGLTDPGDVVGTMRYMPPERLDGQADARGDVYGAGLVLHELITGARVFAGIERDSVLRAIREVGPGAPRALRPELPRDLETIVLKATARDPRDRYASADALADDLERWLEDRPIAARRAGPLERGWRWCRRNRALATLSAVAAASVVVAAATGWAGYVATTGALGRESQRRAEAEAATRRAEDNERLSLGALEGIFDALAGHERLGPRGPSFTDDQEDEARLLQTVLSFYDSFAARNQTDPRLQLEAARSYRRVGLLRARLGEAGEAAAAYARALERLERLLEGRPGDALYAQELAITLLDASLVVPE
ncbi:MAG: serine/threonine protein kinase, partial [Planctomycetes bacterium]|nr:serine/threonine protein kinase [Planctomycetota bacterium]